MTISHRVLLLLGSLSLAAINLINAAEPDGPEAREKFARTAQNVLKSSNFQLLEETADDLRTSKARFPEGVWKLASFYVGLDPERFARTDADWNDFFAKMEAWKKAYPDS